ncbi:MAG: hypothetical protein PGN26_15155 [Xylophilus ampelinus]
MALGWMTALKLVPWGDVIEATPKIVKGAKELFRTGRGAPRARPGAGSGVPATTEGLSLSAQIDQLRQRVQVLEDEQHSAAEVVASMAEQQAKIVQTVDALQKRVRWLTGACAVLLAAVVALWRALP